MRKYSRNLQVRPVRTDTGEDHMYSMYLSSRKYIRLETRCCSVWQTFSVWIAMCHFKLACNDSEFSRHGRWKLSQNKFLPAHIFLFQFVVYYGQSYFSVYDCRKCLLSIIKAPRCFGWARLRITCIFRKYFFPDYIHAYFWYL